jgi:diguanylate cyclase (GGDEF)-like protein
MAMLRKREGGDLKRRPPIVLLVVFATFLVLIGITASALVAITTAHISTASLNATLSRDSSLAKLFVNSNLEAEDLGTTPSIERRAELNRRLGSLVHDDQILRVEIRTPGGQVSFASEAAAVGDRPAMTDGMRTALAGAPSAALTQAGEAAGQAGPALSAPTTIQEYLPIVRSDGTTVAVVAMWRDARPILTATDQAQRDILVVVIAAALVLAGVLFLIFRAAQARISRQQRQLVDATRRDALTDLLNHGAIVTLLGEAVETVRSGETRVSVALLDIDNFRLFNDTHGHAAGDDVLLRVADVVEAAAHWRECVARYGPDEFLLIWPGLSSDDVVKRLGEVRQHLTEVTVELPETERLPVTMSAGIASFPEHAASVTELLSAAAVALQEAKSGGGDAIRVARLDEERRPAGNFDILQGLVIAIDTKDRYTKRHSEDVSRYAVFLARRLGVDDETIEAIRISGLLHDVGKIGIPDTLLRLPGKLTAEEFDVFKQHVALGDAIVRDLAAADLVRAGVRHHHERWDGRGYLSGLAAEEIPLVGRIMAVADAFSAMTTTRPYRKALAVEEALKRLGDAAGTQLEERLVRAFIAGIETDADAPLPGTQFPAIWTPRRSAA